MAFCGQGTCSVASPPWASDRDFSELPIAAAVNLLNDDCRGLTSFARSCPAKHEECLRTDGDACHELAGFTGKYLDKFVLAGIGRVGRWKGDDVVLRL